MAALAGVRVGGSLTLDERAWSVVGLVENPHRLTEEFALVSSAHADPPASVTVLVAASQARLDQFQVDGQVVAEVRGRDERTLAAVSIFAFATVAMLLVCFVAAAGFIAMAQRRMRQFGLLAATGATERQVRLVLLAAGSALGAAAAVLGVVIAAALWIVSVPWLETAAGHRIDAWRLPWPVLGACLLLAVGSATGASWWPAWAASRVPVTRALSLRPPSPRPAHRSALVAIVLLVVGVVCFRLARQDNVALIIAGSAATVVGLALLGPVAIRGLAAAGTRLTVAPRLALRDLSRHQARSGAALAAISLALAVPAVVVITTSAEQTANQRRASMGNLSDRQLMIRVGGPDQTVIPDHTPAQIAAVDAAVRGFTGSLGAPTVVVLAAAVDPNTPREVDPDATTGRAPVSVAVFSHQETPDGVSISYATPPDTSGYLYVASPDLLRFYGLGPDVFGADTDVLTASAEPDLRFVFAGDQPGPGVDPMRAVTASLPRPAYTALPDSLLNPATVHRHGWTTVPTAWLVQTDRPVTTAQLAAARELALQHGLTVESRDQATSALAVRATATAAGGVLALGILAMTVGLIRGEASREVRALDAMGASAWIRRSLAAITAAALALLGAVLGVGVAYLALTAAYGEEVGLLSRVPVADLTVIVVGVPLLAAATAWLLAGRQPAARPDRSD